MLVQIGMLQCKDNLALTAVTDVMKESVWFKIVSSRLIVWNACNYRLCDYFGGRTDSVWACKGGICKKLWPRQCRRAYIKCSQSEPRISKFLNCPVLNYWFGYWIPGRSSASHHHCLFIYSSGSFSFKLCFWRRSFLLCFCVYDKGLAVLPHQNNYAPVFPHQTQLSKLFKTSQSW